jgi:hypothetical protein
MRSAEALHLKHACTARTFIVFMKLEIVFDQLVDSPTSNIVCFGAAIVQGDPNIKMSL